jgi:hypothetical protein
MTFSFPPILRLLLPFASLASFAVIPSAAGEIKLSDAEAMKVGKLIWRNECAGTREGLVSWNPGEEFASLGIGHFIWYPKNYEGPFEESFPKAVAYLQEHGVKLPSWLTPQTDCPWSTLEEFNKAQKGPRAEELRALLASTVALQARFCAARLEKALPKMLETLPKEKQKPIEAQFYRVAAHPHGVYVLMDYVNFKGEGTNPKERYKGEGWGMLHVLERMKGTEPGKAALDEYADNAIFVLNRRIANSPPERGEQRWQSGWTNRCNTYRLP